MQAFRLEAAAGHGALLAWRLEPKNGVTYMLKASLIPALLLPALLASAGDVPAAAPDLATLLQANRYELRFDGKTLGGPGGERLVREGRAADIFMAGENHGAREIGELEVALYHAVSEGKPRRLVTEIGPATATEMEAMLRARSFREFMATGVHVQSVPFYFFDDELPLAESAVAAFPSGGPAVWGLDQEFMAGAPIVLKRLDELAGTPAEHAAVASARRSSLFNPFLFGMGSGQPLRDLQSAFAGSSSPEARTLTDQLVLGFEIYKEQGGDYKWSNERRETLLMENFESYAGRSASGSGPLFFKFGAYHMMRGESPTVQEAFGLRLSRWASARGLSTLNLFMDCHGGQLRDGFLGRAVDCDNYLSGDSDVFAPYLAQSGYTLFDLRPLRSLPGLEQLPKRLKRVIKGYDYFLAVSDTHPAEFLPGRLDTHVYGGILLTGLVLVLAAMIAGIVVLVRRWRRRKRAVA